MQNQYFINGNMLTIDNTSYSGEKRLTGLDLKLLCQGFLFPYIWCKVWALASHIYWIVICRLAQQGSPRARPGQTEQPVRNSSIIISGKKNAVCKSAPSCRLLCLSPYSLSLAPLVYSCGVSTQQADTELNLGGTFQCPVFPKLT